MEGIYPIWKPKGPTSNDVVMELKKTTGIKKIGHAGTLDPLAEGILIIAIGRKFTKQIDKFKKKQKEYIAMIKLGETSTTDDKEGEKRKIICSQIPKREKVLMTLEQFVGKIKQKVPLFSAVKISGREAYKRARAGEKVSLPMRDIEVMSIELLEYKWPFVKLKVVTGSGVYIRSLARDIGEKLGVGGYLFELVRTRIGHFDFSKIVPLSLFREKK